MLTIINIKMTLTHIKMTTNNKIALVGSGTGLKPDCVHKAFSEYKIIAVPVESGVNSQPIYEQEIRNGALNRALRSLEVMKNTDVTLSFGIENGIMEENKEWVDKACIICIYCVKDKKTVIEKWSDKILIPTKFALEAKRNPTLTWVQHMRKIHGNETIKEKDPHSYFTSLTGKIRSRVDFLIETLEQIKIELEKYK